jgi:hypothetical protein
MDVFSLRESLVDQYSAFARSFTQIRAPDIRQQIAGAYESGRFWPDPLIQINPRYKPGRSVGELVAAGTLHPRCEELFDVQLYQHHVTTFSPAATSRSPASRTARRSTRSQISHW